MRHYAFALLAVASVLLCACAKEEQTTGYTRKSITATIDGNGQTRAAVRDVNIVWTDDDAIRVFNADGFASEVWNISDDDSGLETARFFFIGEPQLASGEEAFAALELCFGAFSCLETQQASSLKNMKTCKRVQNRT